VIKLSKNYLLDNLKVNKDTPCWLEGISPEAKGYGVFLLWKRINSPIFYILPEQEQAENIYQDLKTFTGEKAFLFSLKGKESSGDLYQILDLIEKKENIIILSSIENATKPIPSFEYLGSNTILIKKGEKLERDNVVRWLTRAGYIHVPAVEDKGEYSVRGSIVDFFCPLYSNPIRVEFFGDDVESIREFDASTQCSIKRISKVVLSPKNEPDLNPHSKLCPLFQILPSFYSLILDEPFDLQEKIEKLIDKEKKRLLIQRTKFYISSFPQETTWMRYKKRISFHSSPLPPYRGDLNLLSKDIRAWLEDGYKISIVIPDPEQARRIQQLMVERNLEIDIKSSFNDSGISPLSIIIGDIGRGFIIEERKEVIISDRDIFRVYRTRKKKELSSFKEKIKNWNELKEGDYVVHIDYGIGKFKGLVTLEVMGKKGDYFQVNYKDSDRLYVPLSQLDRLHKYIGDSENPPPIYNLEGGQWELTKRRVEKATRELASSLLKLYSIRKAKPGYSFSPDTSWQLEFEASFPYQETPDQLNATYQVKKDMESPFPMDRLICGDSGYGKTEVAIRASFKAVMDNKQVAVLVPTTILADQHYRTFSQRMSRYPVRIEMLSRFQLPGEQKRIIQDLKEGKVDIVIGTHRLLQKDIKFKDLGLVIIDEEQRFGVIQKKKLKELRKTVDVLTLSATPIPRSLYMALMGIYRLSTISSPPLERQNVEIEVVEYNEEIIKQAILREISRGGQVFYLYNRVKDIQKIAQKIKRILPHINLCIAHGQMSSSKLEKTIIEFIHGKYDLLVCTSIIESGIDMPNVNTLIVENAEQFGLADLYQLRGRVGRGKRKGYAYFLFKPEKALTEQAKRRLQIIHQFKGPGSGLKIAMEDLHIRGAGNLLGKEQHGHIAAVGFTLYSQLLAEEIKKLKGEKVEPSFPFHIEVGVEARIPSSYVPYPDQRMQLYTRIGEIGNEDQLLEFKEELRDRFGPLPNQVKNLISLLQVKLVAKQLGIFSIRRDFNNQIIVNFSPFYPLTPEKKEKIEKKLSGRVKSFPLDERKLLILNSKNKNDQEFLNWLKDILQKIKDVLI